MRIVVPSCVPTPPLVSPRVTALDLAADRGQRMRRVCQPTAPRGRALRRHHAVAVHLPVPADFSLLPLRVSRCHILRWAEGWLWFRFGYGGARAHTGFKSGWYFGEVIAD